jgi:hypothetical protein
MARDETLSMELKRQNYDRVQQEGLMHHGGAQRDSFATET